LRLKILTAEIDRCKVLADVGCDHGYCTEFALKNGLCDKAYISDISEKSLKKAHTLLQNYVNEGKVVSICCNGLSLVPKDVEQVLIAGMGGENIAQILEHAPWTADGAHTLILQPMSKMELLRQFLSEHGYEIVDEKLIMDRGTVYPVMKVQAGRMTLTAGQLHAGVKLMHDPLQDRALIERIIRCYAVIAGLKRTGRLEDAEKANEMRDLISEFLVMREEWRHANRTSD
jgi:tRNA (adenine22-N1)-methyltransferase